MEEGQSAGSHQILKDCWRCYQSTVKEARREHLLNNFLHFFIDKVATARALITTPASDPSDHVLCSAVLDLFKPMSLMALENVIGQIKPSGSPCDTVRTHFFKEAFPCIGQSVPAITNSSLSSGVVPQSFKFAVVQHLLKKPGLDRGMQANYRPIISLWRDFCSFIIQSNRIYLKPKKRSESKKE